MADSITIVIIENCFNRRKQLVLLFSTVPDIEIVAIESEFENAHQALHKYRPNVLVINLDIDKQQALNFIKKKESG